MMEMKCRFERLSRLGKGFKLDAHGPDAHTLYAICERERISGKWIILSVKVKRDGAFEQHSSLASHSKTDVL